MVKTDTKEKFHVITPEESVLAANMTAELTELLQSYLQKAPRNLILNCSKVTGLDNSVGRAIADAQQLYYDQGASFVVCGLKPAIENALEEAGILEYMNVTPTESEAWDIVQMEEIEREFLDNDDLKNNPEI